MKAPRSHTTPPRCHMRLLDEDTNPHDESTLKPPEWDAQRPPRRTTLKPPEWDALKPPRWTTQKPPEWCALKPPRWTTQRPPRRCAQRPPRWTTQRPPEWDALKPPRRTTQKPLNQCDQKPPNTITNQPWNASEPPWEDLNQLDQSDQNQPACLNDQRPPKRWTTQKPLVTSWNQLKCGNDLDDWIPLATNAQWEMHELSSLNSLLLKDVLNDVLMTNDANTQLLS